MVGQVPNPLATAGSVVDGFPDAALLLDRDLRILHYNRGLIAFSGLRLRALKNSLEASRSPFELFGRSADEEAARDCLGKKRPVRIDEVPITSPNGERRTAIVSMIPVLDLEGEAVGLIYAIRDVTGESDMHGHYKQLLQRERARAADLERNVQERTKELTLALQEVTRLARTDPLTGALNRRAFTDLADQAVVLADRHKRCMALLMCDLDHFKRVNDTHGHQAGDALLVRIVQTFNEVLRKSDKVGRFGGEEFAILLTETTRDAVGMVADRIIQAVRAIDTSDLAQGARWEQTISIGWAMFPDHGATLDELIGAADKALYLAKESGRDRSVSYNTADLASAAPAPAAARYRILLVQGDEAAAGRTREALESQHHVTVEHSVERASERIESEPFDVILAADEQSDGDGVSFLKETLAYQIQAVRILAVKSAERYSAVHREGAAHVDKFVLEEDTLEHVLEVVEDALRRRELSLKQLLEKGQVTRRAAASATARNLAELMEQRAFHMAYQPIIDAGTLAVTGYEALCRPDPRLFRAPIELFDVAAHEGLVRELDMLIRGQIAAAFKDCPEGALMFVNLHPSALDDPRLLSGDDPLLPYANRVVFEITERASIPDFKHSKACLDQIGSYGFRFAIDDLGAGYATLNSVALLEPHFLKMDRSLVSGITRSSHQAKLAHRIIQFAQDAKINVIAEGIEERSEAEIVTELGCHYLQGFYFARPVPEFARPSLAEREAL